MSRKVTQRHATSCNLSRLLLAYEHTQSIKTSLNQDQEDPPAVGRALWPLPVPPLESVGREPDNIGPESQPIWLPCLLM